MFCIQKSVLLHSEIHYTPFEMKKLFVCVAVMTSVLAVSCKKEEAKPNSTGAVTLSTIEIEYVISSASGNVGVDYIAPNADGNLESKHMDVNRTSQSIKFDFKKGNGFSVSAYNTMPSHQVVQVQIFVDGELKVENSTTTPGQPAVAQGNF